MKCQVAGQSFDGAEKEALLRVIDREWFTEGREAVQFSREIAKRVGVKHAVLTNSGSSANLCALAALFDPSLDNPLKAGDRVITTPGAAFPTTAAPILQLGLEPGWVDIDIPYYVPAPGKITEAVRDTGARAVMLAHTLGNPWCLDEAQGLRDQGIWVIEDCCDALGSVYNSRQVGTFGDLATVSFFPAHHITSVEGGCVLTNNSQLANIVNSIRQWGRFCWCLPGKSNTCGTRFNCEIDGLPDDVDHKYTYRTLGYSMKTSDLHAAVGRAQLAKIESFEEARRCNFDFLIQELSEFSDEFFLPASLPKANPSWFGFPITIRPNCSFNRRQIVSFLEKNKIETRQMFGGNLVRHPAFHKTGFMYEPLVNSDYVLNNSFWVGTYPGLNTVHLTYMSSRFNLFLKDSNG